MISTIIGTGIINLACIYIWSKLLGKKMDFCNPKNYFYFVLLVACTFGCYFYVPNGIRIVLVTGLSMAFVYLFFRVSIKECILMGIFLQLMLLISEILFSFIVLGILRIDMETASKKLFATFLPNLAIAIISILMAQIPFISKVYHKIKELTNRIKIKNLSAWVFIAMLTINIIYIMNYYRVNALGLLMINLAMILIYTLIIMQIISEQNKREKMTSKYNNTLSSLKEYEEILNKYRVSNHENKNQLQTIRNMIKKKETNIPEYIDKLIDNKLKDDEKLMFDVNVIPAGGLRAVVYSKMLLMKEKTIDCSLNIDKKLRTVELIEIGDEVLLNICQVLGVYLDNAIEAVVGLSEKYVDIEMYMEDKQLVISVSNNYSGLLNLDKMDNIGYTTKENGHGYGLPLVKQIIDSNSKLSKHPSITEDVFTQTLKIKM